MAGDEHELQVMDGNKKILETMRLRQFRESFNNKYSFQKFKYGSSNNGIICFDEYDEYGEFNKTLHHILKEADFNKMEELLKEFPPIELMEEFLEVKSQKQYDQWVENLKKAKKLEYNKELMEEEETEEDKKKEKYYNVCSETFHIIKWIKQMKVKHGDDVFIVFVTYPDY